MARYTSQGTEFWFTVGATLKKLAGLQDFNINEAGKSEVDATGMDDTASVTLDGLAQATTVTAVIFWDPKDADQETVRGYAAAANVDKAFQIRMTQTGASGVGKMLSSSGIVTKATPTFGRNNPLTLSLEIKLTSALANAVLP